MIEHHNTLMEFNMLYKEMDELYHSVALKLGLSDSAFFILYALYMQGDGCLQRDICDTFCLSRQTVNSSIKKLEQEDYLSLHQGNGRDKYIHITPKGRQFLDKKIHPVVEMEKQAFSRMAETESRRLLKLLNKYLQNLKNLSREL